MGNNDTLLLNYHISAFFDFANLYGMQVPLPKNSLNLGLTAFLNNRQHAFLALAKHDLIRVHACFALRNEVEINLNSRVPARSSFAGGASEACGAHVLNANDQARDCHHFKAGFEQELFHEGVTLLNCWPISLTLFSELARGKRSAA